MGAASHRMSHSSEYWAWAQMKYRCSKSATPRLAKLYRDRGIRVCERWQARNGFEKFLSDVGLKPEPEMVLDRIDNSKGYEPDNVRWATKVVSNGNRRFENVRLNACKIKPVDVPKIRKLLLRKTQREVAEMFGVDQSTICALKRRKFAS